jgi:hypothetical protein
MHSVLDAHDTPSSAALLKAMGVGSSAQVVPFQRSESVPVPFPTVPTAMHALGELQDTPLRSAFTAPLGFSVVSAIQ